MTKKKAKPPTRRFTGRAGAVKTPVAVTDVQIDGVARICHEANSAYCLLVGDPALLHWDALEESYRESSRTGVRAAHAGNTPAQLHASWMKERLAQGWTLGALDRELKRHPNLVPYPQLPPAQRTKDALFLAIVDTVLPNWTD